MSKVVSFKLSDEEYEALAALQLETSPSITAKRIVKDALGLTVPASSTESTQVDRLEERIQAVLFAAIAPLQAQLDELRGKLPA